MPNNVYIGSRYVPIFDGAWDNTKSYEPLTIVEYGNNTYTSKRPVPVGTVPTNTTYWALTGNYNGQIAHLQDQIDDNTSDITALTNKEVWVIAAGLEENTDITSALTAIFTSGKKFIYIPDGSYIINNLSIPAGCGLFGKDVNITSTSSPCIRMYDKSILCGLNITNNNNTEYGVCINLASANYAKIIDCAISGSYITIHLNNTTHSVIENCNISNSATNGLAISAYQSNYNNVDNCVLQTDYNNGSHAIQFSNGSHNVIHNCSIVTAGTFGIAITGDNYDSVENNHIIETHYEAINLSDSNNCDVLGNFCQWTSAKPSHDHGITIYGASTSASNNMVHNNTVVKAAKAGIALANFAVANHINNNLLQNCCLNSDSDAIKGMITFYDDAGSGHPTRNLISNNLFIDVPIYGIHQITGYQNICEGNMTFPNNKPDYFTDNTSELNKRATICPITPAPTITTDGTINSHAEYWDGEYITGTFNADCNVGTSFTFGVGIAPASDRMFECSSNAGAPVYFSLNSGGTITVSPQFTQAGVTFVYKYRANKYFN